MTKADRNLLDYMVVYITESANRYGMHMRDAYIYLNCYKGIEFLKEFYVVFCDILFCKLLFGDLVNPDELIL